MSWHDLPTEIQLQIFSDFTNIDTEAILISSLSWIPCDQRTRLKLIRKAFLEQILIYRSVSKQWRANFRTALVMGDALETLIDYGREALAFDALNAFIQRSKQKIPQERLDELLGLSTSKPLLSCMELLLQQGASISAMVPPYQMDLLAYTVLVNKFEATKLLLSYNAPFEMPCQLNSESYDNENNSLAIAILCNHIEVAEVLLQAGADPNTEVYSYGASEDPLQYAADNSDDVEMLKLLLRYGLSVEDGRNYAERADYEEYDWADHPLEVAIFNDFVAVARVLLDAGMRLQNMAAAVAGARSMEMRELFQSYC